MSVVDDVQAYLAAQGLVDGATGWLSVRRFVHDGADQLVILTEDGGAVPEFPSVEGLGSGAVRDLGLQVRVRGAPIDSDGALAKALEIHAALHGRVAVLMGATTYVRVRAMTPLPVFLGFDDNQRPEFTTSYRLMTAA